MYDCMYLAHVCFYVCCSDCVEMFVVLMTLKLNLLFLDLHRQSKI